MFSILYNILEFFRNLGDFLINLITNLLHIVSEIPNYLTSVLNFLNDLLPIELLNMFTVLIPVVIFVTFWRWFKSG